MKLQGGVNRFICALVAVVTAACSGSRSPETAAPLAAEPPMTPPPPAPSATTGIVASAKAGVPPTITLEPGTIAIDGQLVVDERTQHLSSDERERLLYEPLANRRQQARRSSAADARADLVAADAVDALAFRDAYLTAIMAGFRPVEPSFAPGALQTRLFVDAPEGVSYLAFVVRPDGTEAWRMKAGTDSPSAGQKNAIRAFAMSTHAADGAPNQKFVASLRQLCSTFDGCDRARLHVTEGTSVASLKRALEVIGMVGSPSGKSIRVQLAAGEPPPNEELSGRLPRDAIQLVVRQHFRPFRVCYEKGLSRNPKLTGRVSARFKIRRDGAVSDVSNAGSDLPDPEVVSCVLQAFTGLEFPKPDGGIVTVVYPLMFAPG
jgi:hypothetical protein